MAESSHAARLSICAGLAIVLLVPRIATAQTTINVANEAQLRAALSSAVSGDAVVFTGNITLTGGDLPSIASSILVSGAGHTLSGNDQFRGLFVAGSSGVGAPFPAPVDVTIQNLTIANTVAVGGAGGSGGSGGGGGAGLGGALFVASQANVTLINVSVTSSSAVGGNGGVGGTVSSSGAGGGGLGGAGGSTSSFVGGGGGGAGQPAGGGVEGSAGGPGILTGAGPGGPSGSAGGANGGGGGSSFTGGGGGGASGQGAISGLGGDGGYGGGGGGAGDGVGGFGGLGGGGGGGSGDVGGNGGYGGGGGGADDAPAGVGGFAGGDGLDANGGGGGGLGGAIFVEGGGSLNISGAFTVNGSSVTGGTGAAGAGNGSGHGAGLFLAGSGTVVFTTAAGTISTIADQIADERGVLGPMVDVGAWSLVKDGAGTLVLSGANAYAGGTFVENGTLSVSAAENLGVGLVGLQNSSTLAITSSAAFSQNLIVADTPSIDVGAGLSATWNGQISDGDGMGTIEVKGGGTLTLGNAANDYSGGTLVTGGSTLAVSDDGALGAASGSVTLGNAVSGGSLAVSSGNLFASSRSFVLGAGGGTFDAQGSSTMTLSGVVSGTGALTKAGAGTLLLSGANTYTGPTTVATGVLQAGATNVFGVNSAMTVAGGATLNLNNFSQTVGSLAGAGSVTLGSGMLTAGGNNETTLFSGVMSGPGSLVKVGTGALVLTGANTYSGGTTVSAGALIGNTTSLQGGIANNALVVFDQAVNGTYAGVMSGIGTLAKTGTGTLTLGGANSYSGGTIVTGNGAIAITTDANLGAATGVVILGDSASTGALFFGNGSTFSALRPFLLGAGGGTFDTVGNAAITLGGSISGSGGLTKAGTGTLTLAGTNSYTGMTNVFAGVLQAGASDVFGVPGLVNVGAGATLDLNGFSQTIGSLAGTGAVTLGSATLTTGGTGSSSLFGGIISGTGSLVKAGGGTLFLTGANMYSGGTTVLAGTLAGNTTSLQGDITNDAIVLFDQNADGTYAGTMTGAGILAKTGSGTLRLTGSNAYTGGTLIEGGSLAGTTDSLRGTIVNNASLTIDAVTDGIFGGVLAGSGSMFKTGGGTLSLFGSHSLGGTTTIAGGTLALNGFLGGSVSIFPGATLRANGAIGGSVDVAGSLFAVAPPTTTTVQEQSRGAFTAAESGDTLVAPPYLTIGGNLTASSGSVIGMPVGPGTNPTILVGGQATLNATQFVFDADVADDRRTTSFLAMTALNGLTMTNTSAVTQSTALVPLLKQDATSLFVILLNYQVPLSGEVTTPNAISVGEVIDRIKMDATGDQADVVRELTALDNPSLDLALESIAGELHASSVQLAVLESESFTDLVRNQLTARAHDAEEEGADGWGGQKIRWWTQLTGEYATFGASDDARGAIGRFGSGAGGMDLRLSNRWLFGVGGGFGAGNMGLRGLSGDTDFRAPRAFGYLGYKPAGFGLRGGGSTSRVTYSKKRRINFAATLPAEFGVGLLTGGVDRQAESEEAGLVSDTWSEYDDSMRVKTYVLDWMIGFRQARFSRGGFSETGALALALTAPEQILTLRHTDVKLHLWRKSGTYRPYVETMFRRELTDGRTDMTLRFSDEPDSDFTVDGVPVPGNMFAGRGGMTMITRLGAWTFEYAIRKAAGQTRQSADVRIRFK